MEQKKTRIGRSGLEGIRLRALLARKMGQSVETIARSIGLHRGSVSRWFTKFKRGGKSALCSCKATGRPKKLDCKKHRRQLLAIVKKPATLYGYENALWTCRRIHSVVRRELHIRVSTPTIWRGLKKLNLSAQKPERRALEQDPIARKKWMTEEWPEIKQQAAEKRALIFFEDESGVRLTPTVGKTWAPIGKTPIIRVTGKRASICVMSAVNSAGRLFFSIPTRTINADVFIAFLKDLLNEYPRRKLFVIADKASPHIAAATRKFADSQPRLELFYLPSYSPDFNPDEEVWNHLKNHELKGHNAQNKKGLRRKTTKALRRMKNRPPLVRSFFYRSNVT